MSDDLRQTVTQAAEGDGLAIDALLERFLPSLRRYLARNAGPVVSAKESASDLAQSVCREVLERLREDRFEYQGEAAFKQWLYQAALHKVQNRYRRYRADRRDVAREAQPDGQLDGRATAGGLADITDDAPETASMHAMRREDNERLRSALAALLPRDRQIIEWVHFDGASHKVVAQRLGVTESSSRVLLARAMSRLARRTGD